MSQTDTLWRVIDDLELNARHVIMKPRDPRVRAELRRATARAAALRKAEAGRRRFAAEAPPEDPEAETRDPRPEPPAEPMPGGDALTLPPGSPAEAPADETGPGGMPAGYRLPHRDD